MSTATYLVNNDASPQNCSSSNKTLVAIFVKSSAGSRFWITDMMVGPTGAHTTDVEVLYAIQVLSAAGAGTAGSNPTPYPCSPAFAACLSTSGINYTAEPTTYTAASGVKLPLSQRNSARLQLTPDQALASTLTASTGFGLVFKSQSYASTAGATVWFQE